MCSYNNFMAGLSILFIGVVIYLLGFFSGVSLSDEEKTPFEVCVETCSVNTFNDPACIDYCRDAVICEKTVVKE